MNSEHCINLITFKQRNTLLTKGYIGLTTDNFNYSDN